MTIGEEPPAGASGDEGQRIANKPFISSVDTPIGYKDVDRALEDARRVNELTKAVTQFFDQAQPWETFQQFAARMSQTPSEDSERLARVSHRIYNDNPEEMAKLDALLQQATQPTEQGRGIKRIVTTTFNVLKSVLPGTRSPLSSGMSSESTPSQPAPPTQLGGGTGTGTPTS